MILSERRATPRTISKSLSAPLFLLVVLLLNCQLSAAARRLSVSPTSLTFGSQVLNTSSSSQTVTLTNTGSRNVTVRSISVSNPAFIVSGWSGQTTLSPSAKLSLRVVFTPTVQGTNTGSLTISSSATYSTGTVSLSGTGTNPAPPQQVSISVSPTSAALQVGGTRQFSASVSGSSNTAVTWTVNGVAGGNSTVGTISTSGLYTAPASVPSGGSVTVTATSAADTTKSANATVSIAAAPVVAVSITPSSAALQVGGTQQFSASVSGSSNTAVTWTVNGVAGGNSTVGTISASGLYTAPASVPSGGSVTVAATSAADTTKSASAAVSIAAAPTSVSVSISPTSASMSGNQTQQFNATVSGTTNTGVTWSVNGVQGGSATYGTISSSGLYTSPACPGTSSVTVRAQSAFDSSAGANANVTLGGGASGSGNYYVATNGSDSNNGSACSPWATLQKANSSVGAGATVHVAPGNYYLSSGLSTSASGSSSAPITWLSDTRWGAKILANSTIDTCWDNTGSNVVIEGFDISESTSGSCRIGLLNEGSNVRISSNRVHDLTKAQAIVTCDGGPGAAGIDAYSSSASGADIVGNVVFHIGDYTQHSCRFIQGIYTAMKNVRVMNNVTYQNMSFGLNMGANSSSNTIANNTAFANGYGGLFMDTYSTNAVVVNNILYNNNGQGINCYSPGPVTIANNLIYGQGSSFLNNGSCSQSGTITSAPVFVNYQANGSGDYHLAAGSPGMDNGTSTGAPKVDFNNGVRPMGSGYDVGAYETGNTPATWPW